jgi:hypothetical protein
MRRLVDYLDTHATNIATILVILACVYFIYVFETM